MAVASIKSTRNGDPATSLMDSSREDLIDGDVITLESIGAGSTTHSWSILFSPDGSTAGLTSTNTAVTQFAVDKEGAYLIRLIVDAGLPTETSQHVRLRALTKFGGLKLVAAGERRDEEAIIPTDIGMYGWAYEQNGNIRKILDFIKPLVQSGRVVHVDSGSENYGDFPSIQEAIDFCVLEGAAEDTPFVVLVREGVYEETLTLKPFVHVISTQHQNAGDIPDLQSKPKLSPRTVVKSAISHDVTLSNATDYSLIVGIHFLDDTSSPNPSLFKSGNGVLQTNACTFESLSEDVGQGALVDLQGGRYLAIDCRFRVAEQGDKDNFAFLQSGENTTSVFSECSFTAPSGLAINPHQHNVGGVLNVLRNCTVKTAEYGLATNGTSTVINSSLVGGVQNLSINWLGSTYGVSNSGNSTQTILFSEIEGDIYWNRDNTNHNNVLKIGAVVFETLNESGSGSVISVEALANALSVSFDTTNSSLTSTNIQEALVELEGLITGGVGTATNIGSGAGIFKQKNGLDLELRTVRGTSGVSVALSNTGDEIEIGYSGVAITNQIDQGDSSVIVTDNGQGEIDFNIDGTTVWKINSQGVFTTPNSATIEAESIALTKVDFDSTSPTPPSPRDLSWNSAQMTLQLGLHGGNVTHYVGGQQFIRVKNEIEVFGTPIDVVKGSVVQIRDEDSGMPTIEMANVSFGSVSSPMGLLAEDIPNGSSGYVLTRGLLEMDTLNEPNLGNEGDPVYVGVMGTLTSTRPQGLAVLVGHIIKKSVVGSILVQIEDVSIRGWYTDTNYTLLPSGNYSIGTPSDLIDHLFVRQIGEHTHRVHNGYFDQLWVNNTNTLHFFDPNIDPSESAYATHVKVDTTGVIPRFKVGNTFCAGIPDVDDAEFSALPPEAMAGLTADSTIFYFDATGNGNHLHSTPDTIGGNSISPRIFFGEYRIPTFNLTSISIPESVNPDVAIEISDQATTPILSSDDAHDLIMLDPTTDSFVVVPRNALDLPYGNLTGAPTNLSQFNNDQGFINSSSDIDFNDISNKPTNVSDFVNDAGFLSRSGTFPISDIKLSELINDSFTGEEIHFSVSPSETGQLLVYNSSNNNFEPKAIAQLQIPYSSIINVPPQFDGQWESIQNKPELFDFQYSSLNGAPDLPDTFSTVASTGLYSDLIGKPTLFSGRYDDLTFKPTLFSGHWNDLGGKPTIPQSINDLGHPFGGSDGDVLIKNGEDTVSFGTPSDVHVDDINSHTELTQGNRAKPVTAVFGRLYLISLISENIVLTLPPANTVDKFRTVCIKLIERVGENYTFTVEGSDGNKIDKQPSLTWDQSVPLYKSMTLYCDGSNWWVI